MTHEEAVGALSACRQEIDEIDRGILALLNQRTAVVERIGAVKREMAMPIYEPRREDEVFRNVLTHNAGPLPPESVRRLFERIIDEMRSIQKARMEQSAPFGQGA